MLFDMETDNGISDNIEGDTNSDSSCSDSCGMNCHLMVTFKFIGKVCLVLKMSKTFTAIWC